jgi:hypothetical protein
MGARCSCGLPTVPAAIMPDGTIMRVCWTCDGVTWWPRVSGSVRLDNGRPFDWAADEMGDER